MISSKSMAIACSEPSSSSSSSGVANANNADVVPNGFEMSFFNNDHGPGLEDEDGEDSCSICLEPFSSLDPPTVTNCKHEYHLQCILEWCQRSKECPICWQVLSMKDPASQELLDAAESERNMRSRRTISTVHENQVNHDAAYVDDSDIEERIMRHFVVAASRARFINRRKRHVPSGTGPSQVHPSIPTADLQNEQQVDSSSEEHHCSNHSLSEVNSNVSSMLPTAIKPSSLSISDVNAGDGPVDPSQSPPRSPRKSTPSELLALSESIKSKWSAASTRYKESITRSTRGFKEKLLAQNNSVKELSKGVQREMNAGIAGVAKLIGRLDLNLKRGGDSGSLSSCSAGTVDLTLKGKSAQENAAVSPSTYGTKEKDRDMSTDVGPTITCANPSKLEVTP